MVYRIRFRDAAGADEAEVIVEASNPAEAIIKFRHIHGGPQEDIASSTQVTSVAAAQDDPETAP